VRAVAGRGDEPSNSAVSFMMEERATCAGILPVPTGRQRSPSNAQTFDASRCVPAVRDSVAINRPP
jgi:hypothetical protein